MSLVKIGFFSLKDHTGCSSFAIHAANYIAGGDNSVAVIEPDTVLEPQYADVQVEKNEDGSFEFNNIHFYPQGCMTEPTEDILIYDFGKVTIFQKFDNSYDMLYLCTSGDISNISDIGEYLTESNAKCELILSGASKEEFQEFKNNGYTCIAVSDKKEMVCPYDLAVKLGLTLRRKGIVDPVYHKDWTYDALPFKKEEIKEEKKGFFGSLFGKKKKDKKAEESIPVQNPPVKTEPEGEEAGLAEEKYHVKANEFGSFDDFEDVPAPEIAVELSKKEQRAAEKAAEKKKEPEAKNLAASIKMYCVGTLNLFAHRTNINTRDRFIVYDTKHIGTNLQELGLQICLNDIWNRMITNKKRNIRTMFYIDEFYLLLRQPSAAAYLQMIWKRARKWMGTPTGITQNIADLLASNEGNTILQTSDFALILSQAPIDRTELSNLYNINEEMQEYITNANPGEGLIKTSRTIVPFENHVPVDSAIYKLLSTKAEDAEDTTEIM